MQFRAGLGGSLVALFIFKGTQGRLTSQIIHSLGQLDICLTKYFFPPSPCPPFNFWTNCIHTKKTSKKRSASAIKWPWADLRLQSKLFIHANFNHWFLLIFNFSLSLFPTPWHQTPTGGKILQPNSNGLTWDYWTDYCRKTTKKCPASAITLRKLLQWTHWREKTSTPKLLQKSVQHQQ